MPLHSSIAPPAAHLRYAGWFIAELNPGGRGRQYPMELAERGRNEVDGMTALIGEHPDNHLVCYGREPCMLSRTISRVHQLVDKPFPLFHIFRRGSLQQGCIISEAFDVGNAIAPTKVLSWETSDTPAKQADRS
jgi:hypothetical protein